MGSEFGIFYGPHYTEQLSTNFFFLLLVLTLSAFLLQCLLELHVLQVPPHIYRAVWH